MSAAKGNRGQKDIRSMMIVPAPQGIDARKPHSPEAVQSTSYMYDGIKERNRSSPRDVAQSLANAQ